MKDKEQPKEDTRVNTGGGAHVEGGVETGGGDFVGRDQITATGKNIFQIGTLIIPLWPMVAAVAILAVSSGLVIWNAFFRTAQPQPMSGLFNVAVAPFGQIGIEGDYKTWEGGTQLGQGLAIQLQDAFAGIEGLSGIVQVRNLDRPVPGTSTEQRAESAAVLAEQLNAHLVIYGYLDPRSTPNLLLPEFYVSEIHGSPLGAASAEIVGQYGLGSGITVPGAAESLGAQLQTSRDLNARTTALSLFTIGLAYYYQGNPDDAAAFFQQALDVEGWERAEGKEVLYLFQGIVLSAQDHPEEALEAYGQALAINPDYAQEHLGIGNVLYGAGDYAAAEDEYQLALAGADRYPWAQLDIRAQLSLGNVHFALAQLEQEPSKLDLAIEAYQAALALGEGDPRWEAAARYSLGLVHEFRGDASEAAKEYRETIQIATDGMAVYAQLGDLKREAEMRLESLPSTPVP